MSKHDNALDLEPHISALGDDERTANNARVGYDDDVWICGKFVRGISIKEDLHEREIFLTPQQAISLLAWLEQERKTLEQLAELDYPWNLLQDDRWRL